MDKPTPEDIGRFYYSVGPLQDGIVEQWTYTNDVYDKRRITQNNFFWTEEGACRFLEYMQAYEEQN